MAEIKKLAFEIVQLSRLALTGTRQDVELYVRRITRKLEKLEPLAAAELTNLLLELPKRQFALKSATMAATPVDLDSRLSLVRTSYPDGNHTAPILDSNLTNELNELINESEFFDRLIKAGIEPTKTVLFVGPPGVGKTHTAKYLADRMNLPLLTVDLSAVMSSFLGKTGNNIRNIFDFARGTRCILFLDELDSLAKKRDDDAEVGELKRLVTVLLQEIDNWPRGNMLLAATNHEDLLDPAIWRRFDRTLKFERPNADLAEEIIKSQLGKEFYNASLTKVLNLALRGLSQAEIIREIQNMKRTSVVGRTTLVEALVSYLDSKLLNLNHNERIDLAELLCSGGFVSQRRASEITGVSRDTIRKKTQVSDDEQHQG